MRLISILGGHVVHGDYSLVQILPFLLVYCRDEPQSMVRERVCLCLEGHDPHVTDLIHSSRQARYRLLSSACQHHFTCNFLEDKHSNRWLFWQIVDDLFQGMQA